MNISQLNKLVSKDKIIPLQDNKDIASSYWVTLQTKSGSVEGKIHIPLKQSDQLVIFEPGFPGGGSTQFEQLWLTTLLQNGYTVFLARHNGTFLHGKYSANYLNCKERQIIGKKVGQGILGNKPSYTIADWLDEPLIAMEVLVSHFSEVTLCGHSFGPLAIIHSLIKYVKKEPVLSKKIHRIVSLSGSLGIFRDDKSPFLKVWYDHLNTDWARERVQIGDAKLNTDIFYQTHIEINKDASSVPSHIEFIAVTPWGDKENSTDEIVNPIESLEFITSLGRGYLILDKKEWGDKKTGRMAHDMEALTDKDLLNLVSTNWLPKSQITTLE
jgi:hypothetical protein